MLKIGDFSKLGNVTVKALRLYAEMNLLRPAWTDRYSGYRYYTLDQLPRLNRILALKDLGLSLEQIRRVLDSQLSPAELRGMFSLKQAELQQKLVEEQQRLARVEARLRQIEREGQLEIEAVALRSFDPLLVAYTTALAPRLEDLPLQRSQARARLETWLASAGLTPAGPWLVIYTGPEYTERDIPFELAVGIPDPLQAGLPADHRILLRRLPGLASTAVYHTSQDEPAAAAYTTLYGWAEQNGYRACGPVREVYLTDEHQPGDEAESLPGPFASTLVEVHLPVESIQYPARTQEERMEPEIKDLQEILVAGTVYEGNNANQEIAAMWDQQFMPRMHELKPVDNLVSYGVCEMDDSLPEGDFRYLAGVEVESANDLPAGMRLMRVPAGRYAIFQHIGSLETLQKTYEYIYQVWMPKSGYKRANRPDLEVYTEAFHDFQPDSILYLWVPIE